MSFFAIDPQASADIYSENALRLKHVEGYSYGDFETMSPKHLLYTCMFRWSACRSAFRDNAPEEVQDILEAEWLKIFKYKVNTDPDYRERFLAKKITPPRWQDGQTLKKHYDCIDP